MPPRQKVQHHLLTKTGEDMEISGIRIEFFLTQDEVEVAVLNYIDRCTTSPS